jgi:hypothetical protein
MMAVMPVVMQIVEVMYVSTMSTMVPTFMMFIVMWFRAYCRRCY